MKRVCLGAAGLAAALTLGAAAASADWIPDVEAARINARAGGPTNGHDAEMLRRWGATTGSGPWRWRWNRIRPDRAYGYYGYSGPPPYGYYGYAGPPRY